MKILHSIMALIFLLAGHELTAAPWVVKITSDDKEYAFGGPLRAEEKPLVGLWRGSNTNANSKDTWEIIRRADHTYTLAIAWTEDGERQTFLGHGLWQMKNKQYRFVDVLDTELEQADDWPVDVKHRIPREDLWVIEEKMESGEQDKLVTTSEGEEKGEIITHTETRVKEFRWLFMRHHNQPESQIGDTIRRALIDDYPDVPGYFEGPLTNEEKILVGRWKGASTDRDNPGQWEIIRRPDHTATITFKDSEDKVDEIKLSHGFWKVQNGNFIYCDLTEEEKIIPWEETYLGAETVVQITKDTMISQWIDPERRVLGGLFAMRIRNTETRVNEFKFPAMQPYSKADPFDSAEFLKRIHSKRRNRLSEGIEE